MTAQIFTDPDRLRALLKWVPSDRRHVRTGTPWLAERLGADPADEDAFWRAVSEGLATGSISTAEIDRALPTKTRERRGIGTTVSRIAAMASGRALKPHAADDQGDATREDIVSALESCIERNESEAAALLLWHATSTKVFDRAWIKSRLTAHPTLEPWLLSIDASSPAPCDHHDPHPDGPDEAVASLRREAGSRLSTEGLRKLAHDLLADADSRDLEDMERRETQRIQEAQAARKRLIEEAFRGARSNPALSGEWEVDPSEDDIEFATVFQRLEAIFDEIDADRLDGLLADLQRTLADADRLDRARESLRAEASLLAGEPRMEVERERAKARRARDELKRGFVARHAGLLVTREEVGDETNDEGGDVAPATFERPPGSTIDPDRSLETKAAGAISSDQQPALERVDGRSLAPEHPRDGDRRDGGEEPRPDFVGDPIASPSEHPAEAVAPTGSTDAGGEGDAAADEAASDDVAIDVPADRVADEEPEVTATSSGAASREEAVFPKPAGPPIASNTFIEARLEALVVQRRFSHAYHLSAAAERLKEPSFTPSIAFKAWALASRTTRSYAASNAEAAEALGEAVDRIAEGDVAASGAASRAAVFAALVRPAIVARDTNAHLLLQRVEMRGLEALSPLRQALTDLDHHFRPSVADLAFAADSTSVVRVAQAEQEIRDWLELARQGKAVHQTASAFLAQIASRDGDFGRPLMAAISRTPSAVDAIEGLLSRHPDDDSLADLVAELERRSGRPKRDKLHGMALEQVRKRLREGLDVAARWLEANRHGSAGRREGVAEHDAEGIGRLKKALKDTRANIAASVPIEGLAATVISVALDDLEALLDGTEARADHVPDDLETSLLCLRADTRLDGDAAVFKDLISDREVSPSLSTAFEDRLKEGAIDDAHRLASTLDRRAANDPDASRDRAERLEDAKTAALKEIIAGIDDRRRDLATLANIDLGAPDEARRWIDWLDDARAAAARARAGATDGPSLPLLDGHPKAGLPRDLPEFRRRLSKLDAFREEVRSRIRLKQKTRCDELAARSEAQWVELVRHAIETRDPATVEEMLADLANGRSLDAWTSVGGDTFHEFHPRFIAAATDLALQTSLGPVAVHQALDRGVDVAPLRVSGLTIEQRQRSKALWNLWRDVSGTDGMKVSREGNQRDRLSHLFRTLGFSSVEIDHFTPIDQPRLARTTMKASTPRAEDWFLPPSFGSLASGHFDLIMAAADVEPSTILDRRDKAKVDPYRATLLVCLRRLSTQQRRAFSLKARASELQILLIDECAILDLLQAPDEWPSRLFRHALPFGYVQPYSTDARTVPEEMFFGRREELARIQSQRLSDGCVVYGGRQLGKSALLTHAQRQFDDAPNGRRAIYLEIKPIGDQQDSGQIWPEIGHRLAKAMPTKAKLDAPDLIDGEVRTWLNANPRRRLLLLLDECDHFLAAEARSGFPNISKFKILMEETQGRFKVVFAGLHNVSQMARLPNSPLVHFGDPICVGPLNGPERIEARRLVIEPLRAAGFEFDDPGIAWDVVTRLNAYPSLIQIFCKEIVENGSQLVRRDAQLRDQGPRWSLSTRHLFEGESAQAANRKISERFQWTLDLDPRFEVIARRLALWRLESEDGDRDVLRDGLSVTRVRDLAFEFWPKGLERLDLRAFEDFLGEMVDLGVLARLGREKAGFGLRSALVAQLLGGRDRLSERLVALSDTASNSGYDPSSFRPLVAVGERRVRSPLSQDQVNRLMNSSTSAMKVVAMRSGDLTEAAETIAALVRQAIAAGATHIRGAVTVVRAEDGRREVPRLLSPKDGAPGVLVLVCRDRIDSTLLKWLADQETLLVRSTHVIVVASLEAVEENEGAALSGLDCDVHDSRPWDSAMISAWLKHHDLPQLAEWASSILGWTGGVPAVLEARLAELREVADVTVDGRRDAMHRWGASVRVTRSDLGVPEGLRRPFEAVARWIHDEPASVEEVWACLDEVERPARIADFITTIRRLERFALMRVAPPREGEPAERAFVELSDAGRAFHRSGLG